jgi:hypothetical protein
VGKKLIGGIIKMTKQEAIEYLEHILETWSAWENHHKKLCDAIGIVLEDVKDEQIYISRNFNNS